MENEKNINLIPYLEREGDMARLERSNKRMFIIVIILIIALVCTNGYWIWYESQFEDEIVTEVSQDAEWDSGNVILNGTGEVNNYGTSESNN